MSPRLTRSWLSIPSRNPASPAGGNHRIAGGGLGEVPASPCSDMLSCHRTGSFSASFIVLRVSVGRVEAVSSDRSSYRELQEVIGTGDSSVYEYVPFIAHYFVVEV
jgi:hypothetical protein